MRHCNKYEQVKITCLEANYVSGLKQIYLYCDPWKSLNIFFKKKKKKLCLAFPPCVCLCVCVRALGHTLACVRGNPCHLLWSPQDIVMSNARSTLIYHAFPLFFFYLLQCIITVLSFTWRLNKWPCFLTTICIFTGIILFLVLAACLFFSFYRALLRIRESFRMSHQSMSVLFVQLCQCGVIG